MKKTSLLFVLIAITVNCIAQQPGFLDKTFGENGLSITPENDDSFGSVGSVILKDNKTLVLGGLFI